MKLKIQKETGLIRNTQKLQTCNQKIREGKTSHRQKTKSQVSPETYLNPVEQKKWERLSPRRKAYFKNRGNRWKKRTDLLQGTFGA